MCGAVCCRDPPGWTCPGSPSGSGRELPGIFAEAWGALTGSLPGKGAWGPPGAAEVGGQDPAGQSEWSGSILGTDAWVFTSGAMEGCTQQREEGQRGQSRTLGSAQRA